MPIKDPVRRKAGHTAYYLRKRDQILGLENRARRLVTSAKPRARKKGLPFDLDQHIPEIQARINTGVCELSGLPFTPRGKNGKMGPLSASLDRIKPELGYVYSNIRIICWALNIAFCNWGEDVSRLIFRAMERKKSRKSNEF